MASRNETIWSHRGCPAGRVSSGSRRSSSIGSGSTALAGGLPAARLVGVAETAAIVRADLKAAPLADLPSFADAGRRPERAFERATTVSPVIARLPAEVILAGEVGLKRLDGRRAGRGGQVVGHLADGRRLVVRVADLGRAERGRRVGHRGPDLGPALARQQRRAERRQVTDLNVLVAEVDEGDRPLRVVVLPDGRLGGGRGLQSRVTTGP